jgi:hypothetical protein
MCRIAAGTGFQAQSGIPNFIQKGNIMATAKSVSTTKKAATATKKTTAAAKPAAKKTVAAKPAAKKVAAPKAAAKKTPAAAKPAAKTVAKPAAKAAAPKKVAAKYVPSPEQRYRMVQDAAYFLAEKNGFAGGALDYWVAAEAQIEALLSGK